VLGYHVLALTGHTQAGSWAPVASQLKAGVAVFFVISGFVLYLPYARAIRDGDPLPSRSNFARRRAVRILPAYWVALTLWAAVLAASGAALASSFPSSDWWRFYGLVQSYQSATMIRGLGVAWSVCVEVGFYIVLPGLAWLMARLAAHARSRVGRQEATTQLLAVAALAAASVELRFALSGSVIAHVPISDTVLATTLPALFGWFAIGLGLAVVAADWEVGRDRLRALADLARRPAWCWLAAVGLYGAALLIQRDDLFLPLYGAGAFVLVGLAAGLLVLPAIPSTEAPARLPLLGVLGSRVMVWLGTVSYGIFLYHLPALYLLRALWARRFLADPNQIIALGPLETIGLLLATAAAGILLGAASWYAVERPAQLRWARRRTGARPELGASPDRGGSEPAAATAPSTHRPVSA
jgi:peptidoglycan/LPS O-acetylase OafA/YrhL